MTLVTWECIPYMLEIISPSFADVILEIFCFCKGPDFGAQAQHNKNELSHFSQCVAWFIIVVSNRKFYNNTSYHWVKMAGKEKSNSSEISVRADYKNHPQQNESIGNIIWKPTKFNE